jgi:putative spermidine/putrescine transport system substrate-binding protein
MVRLVPSARFTRRQTLIGAGSMLAAPAVLKGAWAQAIEDEIVFASNGGAYQRAIETEIFPEFSRRTGIKKLTYVAGQGPENLARMRVQKAKPSIDVVWLAGSMGYIAEQEGLLQPIDMNALPNLRHVPASLLGEKTSVPLAATFMSVLYNREIFRERNFAPPTSWWDMWDPKFKGHVGAFSSNSTGQVAMLTLIAKLTSGDYKNMDAAFLKMKELKPQVVDFFTSPGALDKAIQQKEVWISLHALQGAVQHARAGMPVEFITPKEGVVGYTVGAGVVANAPHPKAAHAWIDYMLAPETQTALASVLGYMPVNEQAKMPADFSRFVAPMSAVFVPDWRYLTGQMPSIVDRWNRIVES